MRRMHFCAVLPEKGGERTVYSAISPYYSAFQGGCKGAKSQFIREISIFIDEKIYSVDRLKKTARSKKSTDGFTYLQVWQK